MKEVALLQKFPQQAQTRLLLGFLAPEAALLLRARELFEVLRLHLIGMSQSKFVVCLKVSFLRLKGLQPNRRKLAFQ